MNIQIGTDFFEGNLEQFENSYFSNADLINIIDFGLKHDDFVKVDNLLIEKKTDWKHKLTITKEQIRIKVPQNYDDKILSFLIKHGLGLVGNYNFTLRGYFNNLDRFKNKKNVTVLYSKSKHIKIQLNYDS